MPSSSVILDHFPFPQLILEQVLRARLTNLNSDPFLQSSVTPMVRPPSPLSRVITMPSKPVFCFSSCSHHASLHTEAKASLGKYTSAHITHLLKTLSKLTDHHPDSLLWFSRATQPSPVLPLQPLFLTCSLLTTLLSASVINTKLLPTSLPLNLLLVHSTFIYSHSSLSTQVFAQMSAP